MIKGGRDWDGIAPARRESGHAERPRSAGVDGGASPDAQGSAPTLTTAGAPPLRPHLVDRMRWLLAAGEVGRDYAGLADILIVSMTRRP